MSNQQIRGELKWRREKWRREWIAKFTERRRIARRWIAFIDLVDWCGESTTVAGLEEEAGARKVAYQRLADSAQKGEFERDGRSKILYLDALVTGDGASPRCRLTREQFKIALDVAAMPPAPSLPLEVLNCCWLPRALVRHWLQSHGYRPAPHLEPAAKKPTARTIHDFDVQVGWVPLTAALEIIRAAAGEPAWEQVKKAIRLKALPARCQADGFTRDLEPHWLDFLAWDDCDGDVLWFDREKAWRRAGRPTDRAGVSVPDRTDNVVVSLTHCAILWPDCAWPKASTAELVGDSAPRTLSLGTKPPPSREKPFWPAARGAAFDWLIDNGCPEPGDGNQAKLEERVTNWLEDHGHEASEAAVRRHVVRWIKERRAELGGLGSLGS